MSIFLKKIGISGIAKFLSIVLNFGIVPLYLKILGTTDYGFWIIIFNLITLMNTLDLGIGNSFKNELINLFNKNKEKLELNKLISTVYIYYSVCIGSIATIIILLFKLSLKLKLNNYGNKKDFFILMVIFICFILVTNLCNQIYIALEKPYINEIKNMLSILINYIVIYLSSLVAPNHSLIIIIISYSFSIIIINLIFTIYILKKIKIELGKIYFDKEKLKKIRNNGLSFFIIQISGFLLFSTDNFLIANFFSLDEVARYNTTYKLFYTVLIFQNLLLPLFWVKYSKAFIEKDKVKFEKLLKYSNYLQIFLILIIIILYICVDTILKIWTGNTISVNKSIKFALSIYMILSTHSNRYGTLYCAINKTKIMSKVSIFQGIVNIFCSIILIKKIKLGVEGIVWGTNISMLVFIIWASFYLNNIKNELKNKGEK